MFKPISTYHFGQENDKLSRAGEDILFDFS